MKFGSQAVRFDLAGIPVVGNTATGTIVGLTPEGVELCDALFVREVDASEVPESCGELFSYLLAQGFFAEADTSPAREVHLTSAYLHVAHTCNLSCVGCYSADCNRNRAQDPSLADLHRALDVLVKLGVTRLVVSGGEPFVRADLPELMYYARARGIQDITVLTNGTCCSDDVLLQLAGNVDTISVSFDGPSSATPAYIRGNQLFDQLADTVGRIQAVGIHAHILPTLHAKNMGDVPAYLGLAERLGCTVGFSLLSGSGEDLGDLTPTPACLGDLARVMSSIGDEGKSVSVNDAFSPGQALSVHVSCGAGRASVSVAATGEVYPCHMLHRPEFSLGNAFTDSASMIAEHVASFALPQVDDINGCSSCKHRYLCGGGCRARSYDEYGSLAVRDPYCAYYRETIGHAVDVFVQRVVQG